MSDSASLDRILRHVYSEPKFKAQVEWHSEFGISAQLASRWPRDEMEEYAATGRHRNPERRLSLVVHDPPDFDWWEPRHDQLWRRQQARDRGDSA